jgi:hypothetical protein
MATLAPYRNHNFFLKKGSLFTDLGKKILSGNLFGTYYTSNSAYYKAVLSQYANFSSYTSMFTDSMNLSTIHTNTDIQHNILGNSSKSVIARHGKPDFVFTDKKLSIFVYKWKFNGLKTRCEVHLYNGQTFLVNYIYNHLDKSERNYILNTVTNKYLSKYENQVDFQQSKISDRNNNLLMIEDFLMGLKITYLCSSESDWYEAMLTELNDRKERHDARVRVSERRFYSKM